MKIELRKISHNQRLSEETNAYSAQVWVDGVHICDVSNHGTGGPDDFHPAKGKTYKDVDALEARVKAERGTEKLDVGNGKSIEVDVDLELVCGELLTAHLIGRDLTRLLKRTIAFYDPQKNEVRSYKGKHEGEKRAALITDTLRKMPHVKILNNLPFDEALVLFQKAA